MGQLVTEDGRQLSFAYEEYPVESPQPGWAQLDAAEVWRLVKRMITHVVAAAREAAPGDPVKALATSSLGEAVVPVSRDRRILGPSLLNFDARGEEYLPGLERALGAERIYRITGNSPGYCFGVLKLMWIREHQPELYEKTWKFLPWNCFVGTMLGGDPVVDHSLADRIMCHDVDREAWSDEILRLGGLDADKLPASAPSGTTVGTVSAEMAAELGLPPGVAVVTGAHDQCVNAVGCGVIDPGPAMIGFGTYICIVPIFTRRPEAAMMMARGLNTEHHAVPGRYVSFIYNQGGALLKWYRDTFAAADARLAREAGRDIYEQLLTELPAGPSGVFVLPHFIATGPPEFVSDSCGMIAGLHADTPRGAVLKGILEGATFYLRALTDSLPETGIVITDYRAAGGGSKSPAWLQLSADILGRPFTQLRITEAGILGAAMIAGTSCGVYRSYGDAVAAIVKTRRVFEPVPARHAAYQNHFERYQQIWPLMRDFLRGVESTKSQPPGLGSKAS
ncbi:MAG: FGGY family carbohydrate kinase [bacterium]|nr:FGGY family carbohydrate kinase [bacterium]